MEDCTNILFRHRLANVPNTGVSKMSESDEERLKLDEINFNVTIICIHKNTK